MDSPKRRSPLRSFALGRLVRRGSDRDRPPARPVPAVPGRGRPGLAAFEDAPCFLEVLEREAKRYREGAENGE